LGVGVDLSCPNRRDRCQRISQFGEKALWKRDGRGALTKIRLKPQWQELIQTIDLEVGGTWSNLVNSVTEHFGRSRVEFGVKISKDRRLSTFLVKPQVISHGHMKKEGA
jgi:hypothetical protein